MVDKSLTGNSAHAPIVIFCYRRPEHLRRTLESLLRCDGFDASPVIVYGDGPRNSDDDRAVEKTREIAKLLLGSRAEYHFRDKNAGLAASVLEGVSDVVSRFGRVIVLEDDLEIAPGFLTYMNQALECFSDKNEVWQVSGYMFDVPELKTRPNVIFLPIIVSWGWGTWERAWKQFDPLATGWDQTIIDNDLKHRFNLYGAYDYSTMLRRQMLGSIDSWAIRWYWTVFKNKGLTVFPPVTLVRNHGLDGSGTHGRGFLRSFSTAESTLPFELPQIPCRILIEEDLKVATFRSIRRENGGVLGGVIDFLRRMKY